MVTRHSWGSKGRELGAVLLSDDDESAAVGATVEHVETCAICQSRLGQFAADDSWWNDARAFLSSEFAFDWKPDLSQAADETKTAAEKRGSLQAAVRGLL